MYYTNMELCRRRCEALLPQDLCACCLLITLMTFASFQALNSVLTFHVPKWMGFLSPLNSTRTSLVDDLRGLLFCLLPNATLRRVPSWSVSFTAFTEFASSLVLLRILVRTWFYVAFLTYYRPSFYEPTPSWLFNTHLYSPDRAVGRVFRQRTDRTSRIVLPGFCISPPFARKQSRLQRLPLEQLCPKKETAMVGVISEFLLICGLA